MSEETEQLHRCEACGGRVDSPGSLTLVGDLYICSVCINLRKTSIKAMDNAKLTLINIRTGELITPAWFNREKKQYVERRCDLTKAGVPDARKYLPTYGILGQDKNGLIFEYTDAVKALDEAANSQRILLAEANKQARIARENLGAVYGVTIHS